MGKKKTDHTSNGQVSLTQAYARLLTINGQHSLRRWVPEICVDYPAYSRPGGVVRYFNFELAAEMGLVPPDHPHKMDPLLEKTLLHTFSIQIINEYDLIHQTPIDPQTIRPHRYMATRYLQLQHPDKKGMHSGDGRSIWNGEISHGGKHWDITSCGTGATCLSPASHLENKFFKTGDPTVSYGCGYSDFHDGLSAAMMSEIFYRQGIPTERTLCLIEYPDGMSINVRAGLNLLRPSHFFRLLKLKEFKTLEKLTAYAYQRDASNQGLNLCLKEKLNTKELHHWIRTLALDFARAVARFERDYIFVWLEWDGDNVLMDGGILDYGSVRQFGCFHDEYRYDDVERFSTTLVEQKEKARHMLMTFLQIEGYLKTQILPSRSSLKDSKILQLFDATFESHRRVLFLKKLGIAPDTAQKMVEGYGPQVDATFLPYLKLEKLKSYRGKVEVPDGITWDAILCMRDLLRELPAFYHREKRRPFAPEWFEMAKSSYAQKKDIPLFEKYAGRVEKFLDGYETLAEICDQLEPRATQPVYLRWMMRSSVTNRASQITGDGIFHTARHMLMAKKSIPPELFQQMILDVIKTQHSDRLPPTKVRELKTFHHEATKKTMAELLEIIHLYRETI